MEDKIQNLHNQANSLQKRILQLENQIIKMAADTNVPSDTQNIRFNSGKRSEQGDYTLEAEKGPSLAQNHPKRSAIFTSCFTVSIVDKILSVEYFRI